MYGALFMLRKMAARADIKQETFVVASLDISKAYDTVSHEALWAVLQGKGIKGEWLGVVQKMYGENIIVADTTEGATRAVDMRQGIRQGCLMSPILFALYLDWVTESLKLLNIHRTGEPTMLAYADDILVRGYSQEEVGKKLQVVVQALEDLGLQINSKKSLMQVNSWGVGELGQNWDKAQWQVVTRKQTTCIPITRPPESFKYLGIWLDADSDCQTNLDKLEKKVMGRLDIIEGLKANPLTKAMLIKSRVVSVINYSLGIHNAPK